jgi:hypothetical protein
MSAGLNRPCLPQPHWKKQISAAPIDAPTVMPDDCGTSPSLNQSSRDGVIAGDVRSPGRGVYRRLRSVTMRLA